MCVCVCVCLYMGVAYSERFAVSMLTTEVPVTTWLVA